MPCATKFRLLNSHDEQYEHGYQLGFTANKEFFINNHIKFILKYHSEKSS